MGSPIAPHPSPGTDGRIQALLPLFTGTLRVAEGGGGRPKGRGRDEACDRTHFNRILGSTTTYSTSLKSLPTIARKLDNRITPSTTL